MFDKYFLGNEISKYGRKHGRVDYKALAGAFDAILNENIIKNTSDIGDWEIINGNDSEEIFQTLIISERGADILQEYTHEIVYYNDTLDMYVWGIKHYGTTWDYVLTEIECKKEP